MKNSTLITLIASALIGTLVLFNSFTTVGVGKEKVGATFGKVHDSALTSGVHLVNPLADFEEYDLQEMTYTWDNIGVPAQDNLKTYMDVSVTGHFMSNKTVAVRENQGTASGFMRSQVEKRVSATVIEVGKELAKDSQAFYGKSTLAQMEDEIIKRLNDDLNPRGYNITAVKFADINLPDVVTKAVVKTKQRQQEVNEQAAKLEIADLKAQERTAVAEANSKSASFNAQAKREMADAKLYEMQQEAEGNKALARSVTPSLIKLKNAEANLKWNGVMPTHVMGEGTNLLMQMK